MDMPPPPPPPKATSSKRAAKPAEHKGGKMRKIDTALPPPEHDGLELGDVCVLGDATFARKAIAVLSKMAPAAAAATAGVGWQRAIYRGCHRKTGGDRAELSRVVRSIAFNLKANGARLLDPAVHRPEDLAALTPGELAEGTVAAARRASSFNPNLEAPADGAWAWPDAGRRLVFVVKSALSRPVFAARFAGISGVAVVGTPIEDQIGNVTAFAASANTFGNMDGGIDRVYAELFGWPYGLPYTEANPLQLAIAADFAAKQVAPAMAGAAVAAGGGGGRGGSARNPGFPELGVGAPALVVPAGPGGHLIASATMDVPGALPAKSRNVYAAFAAIMRAWRARPDLGSMATVPFGTGFGGLPDEVSANQMFEAFLTAWTEDAGVEPAANAAVNEDTP